MIATRWLRDLRLHASTGRSHIAAASGLVVLGNALYVVADDELQLGVFPLDGGAGALRTLVRGTLPAEHDARKARKPDFEMLLRVPACGSGAPGALLALGSGSTPRRARGAWFALTAADELAGDALALDLAPLYAQLRTTLPALNLEGATVVRDTLVLLQRASRVDARNAVVRVPLQSLVEAMRDGVYAAVPFEIRLLDLGTLDGVPWGCTDAAALDDGRIIFSAVAEDASDTYRDGACLGAALGLLSPAGELQWLQPLDTRAKVEGISVRRDGDALHLLLVTDADDARVPAQLLAATLDLAASVRVPPITSPTHD